MLLTSRHRRVSLAALLIRMLASSVAGCVRIETRVEQSVSASVVTFDVAVPPAPATLPLYELSRNVIEGRVAQMIAACHDAERPKAGASLQAQVSLRKPPQCHEDSKTGEVDLYPDLQTLLEGHQSPSMDLRTQYERGKQFLENQAGLNDSEAIEVDTGRVLRHLRVQGTTQGATPLAAAEPVLMYVSARRRIQGYRVDGPGSRASVMVGPDQIEHGFTRSWKRAGRGRDLGSPDAQEVSAQIERQLLAVKSKSRIHVQQIEVAYYDGNQKLLQPVYRFVAEFNREPGSVGVTEHVVGYVPFASLDEPVPQLGHEKFPEPAPGYTAPVGATQAEIKVGRYIARNDHKGWITDATSFWSSIDTSAGRLRFANAQVLAARPELFTIRSHDFVDSVDIALVEAHGAPWEFATESNCCDRVQIGGEGFPSSGYGPVSNGRLKHWILHSCEVVPSPAETPEWANRWWGVFKNGLYTVLGYRTPMFINDGAGAAIGRRIGLGEPIVSAWLTAVGTLNVYGLNASARFRCDGREPMGLPSAIAACGAFGARAGETVQVIPDCLDAFWIEDERVENIKVGERQPRQ
jgi:hypothetical protein